MKNITLSVEESVLESVRRYAAERNLSVNGVVRQYFRDIAAQDDRASRAKSCLMELSKESKARLGTKTWTRDELHER